MYRRAFMALTVAGLAFPLAEAGSQSPAPVAAPSPLAPSGDPTFDAWLADFYARTLAKGQIPQAVLDRELAGLAPDPRVNLSDASQPEFSRPVGDYIKGVVTEERITIGRRMIVDLPFLTAIETRFGVPREALIGVWALESAFGKIQGSMDVLRSMATLAAAGRRRAWAEDQIRAALTMIASGEVTRAQLKGSWAGAMGQTQFIPATYLTTAVDGDGDGKRDIWGSNADALASAANLLAKGGWVRGGDWAREVILPAGFDYGLSEGSRDPPSAWAARGARRADGKAWSATDEGSGAMLLLPAGAAGPAFLAFPNHFAIRQYNNSMAYALGVGLLADRFAGGGPLAVAWPPETPLSLTDRLTAQESLKALGFDPGAPDGVIGLGTRNALRAYQKSRALPADGYLSQAMVRRLQMEAGSAASSSSALPQAPLG